MDPGGRRGTEFMGETRANRGSSACVCACASMHVRVCACIHEAGHENIHIKPEVTSSVYNAL